ncbi:hypothetical protein [Jeongeupia sp. USM3]|uniref:hypothetical protein n=1 Tax=Jeongeupia sp. USM3 TaxID=1906741 RepID=UPI00089E077C|nr:hypothetical protein [Jeongeupia sp. USM3]AOY00238.1 hypothetical protein BJP62_07140 [Jeongeupia sp. USM3]
MKRTLLTGGLIASLLLAGCESTDTRNLALGAAALTAAGAVGYYAGKHRDHQDGQATQPVNVQDLAGDDGHAAESALRNRGFAMVDRRDRHNGNAVEIWRNSRTHQCVRLRTDDGHVRDIRDTRDDHCG